MSDEEPDVHALVEEKLRDKYNHENYSFGWPDLNLVRHAERVNQLSSIFLTHVDLLDDLSEIRVATEYER